MEKTPRTFTPPALDLTGFEEATKATQGLSAAIHDFMFEMTLPEIIRMMRARAYNGRA